MQNILTKKGRLQQVQVTLLFIDVFNLNLITAAVFRTV